MRAFLLVLMLTLLPLQFSVAAWELYRDHAIHHDASHAGCEASAVADDGTTGSVAGGGASSQDCGTCHVHGAALAMADIAVPVELAELVHHGSPPRSLPPLHRERPDRPKWPAPNGSGPWFLT
jgi:hypothetical protein